MLLRLQIFLQLKYFLPDPIKNDVKYQVQRRISACISLASHATAHLLSCCYLHDVRVSAHQAVWLTPLSCVAGLSAALPGESIYCPALLCIMFCRCYVSAPSSTNPMCAGCHAQVFGLLTTGLAVGHHTQQLLLQ